MRSSDSMSNIVVFVDAGFVLLLWREPSWLICSSQQRFQVRRSIRMFRIQMTCRCMWIYRDRENKQNRCARMSASSWCTCNDQADVCTYAHNKTRWAMFLFKARESLESMFILANDHRKYGLCCTSCLFWQRIIGNPVYPAINPKA